MDEKILERIIEKCEWEGECIVWKGSYNKSHLCHIQYVLDDKQHRVSVTRFLLNYSNPDTLIKRTEKIVYSCGNSMCMKMEHISIEPIARPVSKQEVWERMLTHSNRNDDRRYNEIGCLEWNAYKDTDGYGHVTVKYKMFLVHRVSYWIHHEEFDKIEDIPTFNENGSLEMAHKCNNRCCFEPLHIKLCSKDENAHDKLIANTLARGEKHYNCKITEELAGIIKLSKTNRGDENHISAATRAKKFGVPPHVVRSIDRGASWRHLPNKNGETSPIRKKETEAAKKRVWTAHEFEKAQKKLDSNSEIDFERKKWNGSYCVRWTAWTNHNKYGMLNVNGLRFFAHVLACCIKNNTLEKNGLEVLHSCGNRLCVNQLHLKFGTHTENVRDKVLHGTSNHKLDMKTANKIRFLYKTKKSTQVDLGKRYGVSKGTINKIVNNKIYIDHSKTINSGSKTVRKNNIKSYQIRKRAN